MTLPPGRAPAALRAGPAASGRHLPRRLRGQPSRAATDSRRHGSRPGGARRGQRRTPGADPAARQLLDARRGPGPALDGLRGRLSPGRGAGRRPHQRVAHVPVLPAMVTGEVHLSGMDPGASILASLEGLDTVLLATGTNRSNLAIIAQPTIQQPQDLKGKALGITRLGSSTHIAALQALDLWGLEPDRDVALRQMGEASALPAALEAKQIDAAIAGIPGQYPAAAQRLPRATQPGGVRPRIPGQRRGRAPAVGGRQRGGRDALRPRLRAGPPAPAPRQALGAGHPARVPPD